jgi:HSP20 family molecular chaperone IbpA
MSEKKDIAVRSENQPERVSRRPVVAPAVDIFESADDIVLLADLPGVAQDGVRLDFEKDELRIDATTTEVGDGGSPLFREFGQRDYRRAFQLAPGIDVDKITAELKGGVLTVTLPKAAALKPRQIAIKPE